MKTPDFLIRALLVASFFLLQAACMTPGNRLVKSIDRDKPGENDYLWRRINDKPARFIPASWPAHKTGSDQGRWVTDLQDGAQYFVLRSEFQGLTPAMWEAEARKHLNINSTEEQRMRNAGTAFIGLPLEITGRLIGTTAASVGP